MKPSHRAVIVALMALGPPKNSLPTTLSYVLTGTILTPDQLIPRGSVVVEGDSIMQVGVHVLVPRGAVEVDVGGVILPGMVDLHDHMVWNVFPRWHPTGLFRDRYEWQQADVYGTTLSGPRLWMVDSTTSCQMERYAEIKALAGGATSVVGSLHRYCIWGLARNLDYMSDLTPPNSVDPVRLSYQVFPLELSFAETDRLRVGMDSGQVKSLLVHLSEGIDASARREFSMFKATGLLRPGTTIIHGLALRDVDFHEMDSQGVGLVWSPRSNIELYGMTTNVAAAKAEHVKIAIAPDWSPTGSTGMISELRYANEWDHWQGTKLFTDSELIRMVTVVPAQLVHLDGQIGSITQHHRADLIVLAMRSVDSVRHDVVMSGPADLRLVMVGGVPLYGDSALMAKLGATGSHEFRHVCERPKAFNVIRQGSGESLTATDTALTTKLRRHGVALAPLQECP